MSAARSPFNLAGPTALATGGTQGLGRTFDILVNNAGTCYLCESWVVTDEQWDAVFDLNVKAL